MKPLSRWAIDVLNLFHWFRRVHGRIFPSVARIREMLGNRCCIRTIKRATRELVEAGKLWKTPRYRRSTEYSLTPPENAQMAFEFAGVGVDGDTLTRREQAPRGCLPVPQSRVVNGGVNREATRNAWTKPAQVGSEPARQHHACPRLVPPVVKPSLRSERREVFSPLVVFLTPVQARRKLPRRQTALERATEVFLREG